MDEETKRAIAKAVADAVSPYKAQLGEMQEKHDKLRTEFSDLKDENLKLVTENKDLKAEKSEREEESARKKIKMAREGVTKVLDDAVKAKKITPAQRDRAIKLFDVDDDDAVVKIDVEEVKAFFSLDEKKGGKGKVIDDNDDTTRSGGDDELPEGRTHKNVFDEMNHRVRQTMAEKSYDYRKASRIVFAADPDLHREYLNSETPEQVGGEAA